MPLSVCRKPSPPLITSREVNSDIEVEPEIADVNHSNIERLIEGADVVLDGTDNFATRYLINDACIKNGVNWIYGAAVGSYGVTMTVRPHETPCLRCIFPEAPPAASAPTCDTAGVIMPIISIVASVQVSEALKLLTGDMQSLHNSLMQFDVWRNEWRQDFARQQRSLIVRHARSASLKRWKRMRATLPP